MNHEVVEEAKEKLKKKLKLKPDTDKEILKDVNNMDKMEMSSNVSMKDGGFNASFNINQTDDKTPIYKNYQKTFKNVDEYAEYLKKFFAANPD